MTTEDKALILVAYSDGGRMVVEWLAESLRHSGISAVAVNSASEGPGSSPPTEALFRKSDGIVAVVTAKDVESPAVYFDLGAAAGMDKPFILLAPADVARNEQLPASLRRHLTVLGSSAEQTASAVLSRAFPPAA